jgi:hypothetical protein
MNKLAERFVHEIKSECDSETFAEICRRNRRATYDGACASHDFMDANICMANAFEFTFGREYTGSETDTDLINDAWDAASDYMRDYY